MSDLSAVDIAQTEAQIVGLKAQKEALLAADPNADVSALDAEIKKLQNILVPPPQVFFPPEDFLPRCVKTDKRTGKVWKTFYYCGGWYAAPTPDHPVWPYFVSTFGETVANDPKNRIPVEGN